MRSLRCPLAFADGTQEDALVSLVGPHDVVFDAATPQDAQCQLCFSELRFEAELAVRAPAHAIDIAGPALLRELEAGDGFAFELRGGEDLKASGLLQEREPSLRLTRVMAEREVQLAQAAGPCVALPHD
ncbi:MAG TPA: hypothetical protein VFX59_02950 [Polyangiales bacterium]|nr:hypothetical protein [Polyangiales bacterium]